MLDRVLNTHPYVAKQIGCIYTQHVLTDTALVLDFHFVKSVQTLWFFWSVFSHIPIKYAYLLGQSAYSVRIRENTDQENSIFAHFSDSVLDTMHLDCAYKAEYKADNTKYAKYYLVDFLYILDMKV